VRKGRAGVVGFVRYAPSQAEMPATPQLTLDTEAVLCNSPARENNARVKL
jgi:hypothetical protein